MSSMTRSSDGTSIDFAHADGPEPALVFVHGMGCERQHWDAQLRAFAPRHAVVAMDLAGHGASGKARSTWTMSAFAEDVAAVVHSLRLKKVILVGHSMGGSVIVYAAHKLDAAVAGLVGVDTWSNLDQDVRPPAAGDPSREDQLESLRHDFKRSMDTWIRTMFIPGSDPELVERVVATMSAAPQQLVLDIVTWMRSSRDQFQKSFDELCVPKHAIGTDTFIPRSVETARRHGIHLVKMTGVGHFVMMEDAATFNRHLDTAVAQIMASGT